VSGAPTSDSPDAVRAERLTNTAGAFGIFALILLISMVKNSSIPSDVPILLVCIVAGAAIGPALGVLPFLKGTPVVSGPLGRSLAVGLGGVSAYLYFALDDAQKFWWFTLLYWVALAFVFRAVALLRQTRRSGNVSSAERQNGGETA